MDKDSATEVRRQARALMRRGVVDPHEATAQLLPKLVKNPLIRMALAEAGLLAIVREEWSQARGRVEVPRPVQSRFVTAMRAKWQRALIAPVFTGSQYVALARCTVDDLAGASAEAHKKAAENTARATLWETLADLLEQHDVERVEQIPVEVLAPVLEVAA